MKKNMALALLLPTIFICSTAYAGGLQTGISAVSQFRDWLYTFLGVVAFIYLMYKGLEAWAEKVQWIDFLIAVGKVAGVGASLAIAQWAWTLFA